MLDSNKLEQYKRLIKGLMMDVAVEMNLVHCCINCENFDEDLEVCTLSVPPARPPVRVITFGCEAFKEVKDDT